MWNPGLRGLAVVLLASSAGAGGSGWQKDIEQAFKKAKKSRSFLLVEFTDGRSSGTINKKIFKSSGFKRWAKGKVVLVEINYGRRVSKKLSEQYAQLKTRHKIESFPTVLLLDSEGTSHGTLPFAADTELAAWLTSADEVLEAAASPGKWFTDWAQAKRIARRLKRPMLVSFDGSDW